jgi:dephospho-CoA kinase
MLVIGLTGPSGAGKGLFCKELKNYGVESIDADAVYHSLLIPPSPCLDALSREFGKQILTEEGTLNRRKLADIVFSPENAEEKSARIATLNTITHGYVMHRIEEILKKHKKNGVKAVILDAPALYEAGADKQCDLIVTVIASRETRLRRIVERDRISPLDAQKRIRAQHPDEFYTARAHKVFFNDGGEEEFQSAVRTYYEDVLLPRISAL